MFDAGFADPGCYRVSCFRVLSAEVQDGLNSPSLDFAAIPATVVSAPPLRIGAWPRLGIDGAVEQADRPAMGVRPGFTTSDRGEWDRDRCLMTESKDSIDSHHEAVAEREDIFSLDDVAKQSVIEATHPPRAPRRPLALKMERLRPADPPRASVSPHGCISVIDSVTYHAKSPPQA